MSALSYTHGVATKPLIGKTIGDMLDGVAAEFTNNEALLSVFENKRFTYGQFLEEVNRCARALMAVGVEKGDRVGIWSTNCAAWTVVQFATAKIGAILVNITGRLKDMICRGGEKIFPREVEEFLFTHPKIAEAYVIGVPDTYYGEQVMAWVKLKDGQTLTAEELRRFCTGKIMNYKIPHHVKFVTEFPTTVTGKIQKFRMREISAEELGMKSPIKN